MIGPAAFAIIVVTPATKPIVAANAQCVGMFVWPSLICFELLQYLIASIARTTAPMIGFSWASETLSIRK